MKRILKWTAWVLATPILLFMLLAALLYVPPVQDWVVRHAAAWASEATGLNISLERLRLRFPLDLDVQELLVRDADGDTIAAARSGGVDLDLTQVLRWRVGVEGIALDDVRLDTKELITTVRVAGCFGKLTLKDDVDLALQRISIADVGLEDAYANILIRDTVPAPDTTETVVPLEIAIERAEISRSHVCLAFEADTTCIDGDIRRLVAEGGELDLKRQLYDVRSCEGELALLQLPPWGYGLAPMDTLALTGDGIRFDGEAMHIALQRFGLRTPDSRIRGALDMDISAFGKDSDGQLTAQVDADLGREDMARLCAWADSASLGPVATAWPDVPLHLAVSVGGNMDSLNVEQLDASLAGALDMETHGTLTCLLDSASRGADMAFNIRSGELTWLQRALGIDSGKLRLPPMTAVGQASLHGSRIETTTRIDEGAGTALIEAQLTTQGPGIGVYAADADIRNVNVHHFLPGDSIGTVTARLSVEGYGTDIYSRSTRLDAKATVSQLRYGRHYDLRGLDVTAHVRNGQATGSLMADNDLVTMRADVAGMLQRPLSGVTFGLDVSAIDLKALGLSDKPLSMSACLHMDGSTNLSDSHSIDGTISDMAILTTDSLYRPADIELRALLRRDTVHAFVSSGDLMVTVDTDNGVERLLKQSAHLADELAGQWQKKLFDLNTLRRQLPNAQLHIIAGRDNPICDILKANDIEFDMANIDLLLSPDDGINSGGRVYKMMAGGIQLDTITFLATQDTTGIALNAHIHNGRRNPQFRFDATLDVELMDTGAVARLKYIDERGRTGVDLGLDAAIVDETLRLHINPHDPIIAFRPFHTNADNYLTLHRKNRIETNIRLLSDDGTGLSLYSTPNEEALQDLTLGIHNLNLGELMSVVPYAPKLTGFLDGDIHLLQQDKALTVSADVTANKLVYEGANIGQLGVQAVYLPNADGSHFIDGSLLHTGMPVATFGGTLGKANANGVMTLDVDAALERFPIELANGFIPEGMAALSGQLIGDVHIGGTSNRPDVNGAIVTDDVHLRSDQYSLDLRLDNDTITVKNSQLTIDDMRFFAQGSTPFVVNGTVDFADTERIRLDVNMSAQNYELMNAKKTAKAVTYGKVYVDFTSQLRGTLDNLRLMGRLKLLSGTDLTYVLTDSPLSDEDQLEGLVEFVDFSDTLKIEDKPRTRPQHLNIMLAMNIDESAKLHCLLSADGTNYVNIIGGGDLTLSYSPERDLQLNGRYTINSGTLKYTMMVIPLKEFDIKRGSFVEFRGPATNPYLNISATERLTTTVTSYEQPRGVVFDVGLTISQTLTNMGLEFTLEAPEDMMVQNELASMTAEQRGRAAVTMLATGMYLSDSGSMSTGGFSAHNALNAFLQSQISNIAGKAIKSVDISMGVEQGTGATSATTTDYTFRLAKRFWNDRISVIVGGRVSTGSDAVNTGASILDNVTVEYRLDKSGTRNVYAFYNKDRESLIDGIITEMGAGLVLRRKSNHLGELFLFRQRKNTVENGKTRKDPPQPIPSNEGGENENNNK